MESLANPTIYNKDIQLVVFLLEGWIHSHTSVAFNHHISQIFDRDRNELTKYTSISSFYDISRTSDTRRVAIKMLGAATSSLKSYVSAESANAIDRLSSVIGSILAMSDITDEDSKIVIQALQSEHVLLSEMNATERFAPTKKLLKDISDWLTGN
jgi:F0F1-type ATP synthase beta subunit